jgi:YHS domain-containing protein
MLTRRQLLMTLTGLALAGTAGALVVPRSPAVAATPPVYTGIVRGVAAGGYDVVAYFTAGQPTRGNPAITLRHQGAEWRFASEANREMFRADPARYAPQYGGHCSWAAAQGYAAKGDPLNWAIVNGRLFLNYDATIHARWQTDVPGHIARADRNWPNLR